MFHMVPSAKLCYVLLREGMETPLILCCVLCLPDENVATDI
jgi:hypothetical protein